MTDLHFHVGPFVVSQVSKKGLWLVTTKHLFDLGMLFLRVQEFYESPNPEFQGKAFRLLDYMRWYCLNESETGGFDYLGDVEGFNVPSEEIEKALDLTNPDPNQYDLMMVEIATGIQARQRNRYYLIGARSTDAATIDHEIAHGMFYLMPEYRSRMTKLVEALPARIEISNYLVAQGYCERSLIDEAQAYLATGLYTDLAHLEPVRHPFMTVFADFKKKLMPAPRKPKEVACPTSI